MIRRPPSSTHCISSAASDVYKRQVLGRYLEHSRIFAFAGGGDPAVFIGSADMMHRNLDRRVEALVRLSQPDHIRELNALFDTAMSDSVASWYLSTDGTWTRHQMDTNGNILIDLQDQLMKEVHAKRHVRI